ncbi:integrase family protein [Bradyrhizobium sp. PRIMUS42]|uniref:tyrosine-type recombinase/integrase n=1 Tax=Bradyrhizobium sp. PRIMUS42 TaxID=2908926 RepID=UPI001FF54E0B|nr:integrase family protein [Bradyrhizobium sp. PRIMUS42]MCJ9730546.1 integrase family protein [Bradyrhizobium sp. PRIMUS42]
MSGQTITKTLVDGLEKQPSEYTVWDAKLPGFGVRVRPTGAKSFIVVYRAGTGRTAPVRRYTVAAVGKLAPEAARTQAKILLGNIANGADPAAEKRASRPKRDRLTFDALADRYIAEYVIGTGGKEIVQAFNQTGKWPAEVPNANKKSWKNDVQYLKRPREEWGCLIAASITDDDVADLLDLIADDAPVSANRTQSILHKMFKWGMQPGRKYVPLNPLAGLERRGGREKKRDRVLADDEIRNLWWGLDLPDCPVERPVALAIKFILATMVRPYQAAGARTVEFTHLGTADALYDMPPGRVKKDRAVLVPLSELAQEIVREATARERSGIGHNNPPEPIDEPPSVLFPSKFSLGEAAIARASISQALNGKKKGRKKGKDTSDRAGVREFLGLAHFTAHDLRRTAATIARRAGAPRPDVKALLDHVNGDVTAVYDKYDMLSEKRQVATILEAELRKIIGTRSNYCRREIVFDRDNIVSIEEQTIAVAS